MQHQPTRWIRGLAIAAGLMILGTSAAQAQCMRGGGADPGTGGAASLPGQGAGGGADRIGGGARAAFNRRCK